MVRGMKGEMGGRRMGVSCIGNESVDCEVRFEGLFIEEIF